MRTAWEDALKKDADFYLWLNDDTVLHPFAVSHLLEASLRMEHAAVICGSTCHPGTDEWTYGGTAGGKPVIPDGTLRECELCHGNILWVPRRVVERIGILDGFYLHALGGLRLFPYGARTRNKAAGGPRLPGNLRTA